MTEIREGMSGKRVAQIISENFKYLDDKIENKVVTTYNELLDRVKNAEMYVVESTKQQVILADNEDTTVIGGKLKLADREFLNDGYSGKGFKILRQRLYGVHECNCPFNEFGDNCENTCECCCCQNEPLQPNKYIRNVLLQDDFNWSNTRYIVRYDFDLNGQTIKLPAGCDIVFEGGTFKNGTLNLNNAKVHGMIGSYTDYFTNTTVQNPHSAQTSIFK